METPSKRGRGRPRKIQGPVQGSNLTDEQLLKYHGIEMTPSGRIKKLKDVRIGNRAYKTRKGLVQRLRRDPIQGVIPVDEAKLAIGKIQSALKVKKQLKAFKVMKKEKIPTKAATQREAEGKGTRWHSEYRYSQTPIRQRTRSGTTGG